MQAKRTIRAALPCCPACGRECLLLLLLAGRDKQAAHKGVQPAAALQCRSHLPDRGAQSASPGAGGFTRAPASAELTILNLRRGEKERGRGKRGEAREGKTQRLGAACGKKQAIKREREWKLRDREATRCGVQNKHENVKRVYIRPSFFLFFSGSVPLQPLSDASAAAMLTGGDPPPSTAPSRPPYRG